MRISLVRPFAPASWVPAKSTRHISSGFMNPLLTRVGVQMARSSPTRTAMLPPLPSTYSRSHRRRPTSQICSLIAWTSGEAHRASISAFGLFELTRGRVAGRSGSATVFAARSPASLIKSSADGV